MIEENKQNTQILEEHKLQNQLEKADSLQEHEKQIMSNKKQENQMEKENLKEQEVIEKEKTPMEIEKDKIKKGKKDENFIILTKEQQQQKIAVNQKYRKIKLNSIKNESRILKRRQQLVNTDEIFCVRFSNDDKLFAVGCGDGSIQIQEVKTSNLMYKIMCAEEETPTTILRWRPSQYSSLVSNILVIADSDGLLTHWHIPSGCLLSKLCEPNNSIFALDYTVDGQCFVTGGKDCEIKIYSESRQEIQQVFSKASWQHPGHANRIFSIKCCQNNEPMHLVSGGWDSNLHLWDIRQKKSVACCYGPLVQGDSIDVSENEILVGGYRHGEQIMIYDVRNLSKLKSIVWENRCDDVQVYCCQFEKFKKGKSIAAASVNVNEMRLFDPVNNYEGISVAEMSVKGCYTLDYGNVSNLIGFGGGDGIAYICDLPNY